MAINLGDINFGLGPDTRRLEEARRQVLRFGEAVNRAALDQSDGARATEAALRRQEKAITSTLNQILKMNDALRRTGDNPAQLNRTTASFNRLVREMAQGRVSALQFQRSMEDVQASLGRVSRAAAQHKDNLRQTARAEREAAAAAKEQDAYTIKLERTLASASRTVAAFNAQVARARAPTNLASGASTSLKAFQGALGGGMLDPVTFNRISQQFQNAMARNTIALRNFQKHGEQTKTAETLERLANISVLLHGPLSGIASRFALIASLTDKINLKTAALVTGISAGAYAFVHLGQQALNSAKAFQRIEQSIIAVQGPAADVSGTIEYLRKIADRSGKSFDTIATGFTRITAAAKGTNLEGSRAKTIFEAIVMSGAKLSSTDEEITGTLRAVEQIMSKGSVQAEELRGQLGDRLAGAFNIMSDALGITTKELTKMMEQGRITSDALLPFAEELAKRYGVDAATSINTVTAAEGRLATALLFFGRSADEAIGFSKAYMNVLNSLTGVINWASQNMDTLAAWTGAVSGAFLGLFAPQIISGFMQLLGLIRTMTAAVIGLNVAMMANPIGALASLLVRLALAIGGAIAGFSLMKQLVGDVSSVTENEGVSSVKAYIDAQLKMKNGIRATTEEFIKQQEVISQNIQNQYDAAKTAAQGALDWIRKHSPHLEQYLNNPDFMDNELVKRSLQGEQLTAIQRERDLYIQAKDAATDLLKLQLILSGQKDAVDNPLNPIIDPEEKAAALKRIAKAVREAEQAIGDLKTEYDTLFMNPQQKVLAEMQSKINQETSQFRDRLVDAGVPMAALTDLTTQYNAQLTLLAQKQYELEYLPNFWTYMGEVLGQGVASGMDMLIDTWIAGGDALASLADIGRTVATDLIKSFARLAVINPLLNMLGLGGSTLLPTFNLGSFMGGGGGGGLLGATSTYTPGFGSYGAFAGGGSFTIPGGGAFGGMDSQLVSFYGKPGEKVSIGKTGHGADGGGTYVEGNTYYIDASNSAAGVEDKIIAAIKEYDKTAMTRVQQIMIKGRAYRKPGM